MSLAKQAAEQTAPSKRPGEALGEGQPKEPPLILRLLRSKKVENGADLYREQLRMVVFGKPPKKKQKTPERLMGGPVYEFRRPGAMNAIGDVGHSRWS